MLSKNPCTKYYLALKRKGIQTPAATWFDPEDTVDKHCGSTCKKVPTMVRFIETEGREVAARGRGRRMRSSY